VVKVYDSTPRHFLGKPGQWNQVIREVTKAINWGNRAGDCEMQPVAKQSNNRACNMHTILNGWTAAMRLPIDPDFVAKTAFYNRAMSMN
jgi:hypothetical protein